MSIRDELKKAGFGGIARETIMAILNAHLAERDSEIPERLAAARYHARDQRERELVKSAKLTVRHFDRNNKSGNVQGDDEHDAWRALRHALAAYERSRETLVSRNAMEPKGGR